ncbi:MAG: cobyrinate a,c-diamide synthase, partial [Desulfobacterales bacterium]
MKGIVVAGTKSGCGKTTVSLGLMAALVKRGLKVAPFKVGPDFIDPGHHSRIAGVDCRNLDGWMLSRNFNLNVFANGMKDADIAVVEGVMGLFDGYDGKSEAGSTAQIAKWLGLPVILLVDAASMARSAAAVVMGFEHFDAEL